MSAGSPTVSIITATYNRSAVLRYAIQSVLWQTFQDFEMLVVGDACTDDSADVVASFGDPRLRWRNLAENSGNQSGPNNAGLDLARGKYIAYLGHDDVWRPTHLDLLVRAMQASAADFAYTITVCIGPPGSGIRVVNGISASGQYERGLVVPPSSMMHTRELARAIGGWRDYSTLKIAPDFDFITRAFDHGARFTPVNALTVFKFNSAWRPNSYRDGRSDEQAEYVRRLRTEADFLERELLDIVTAYVLNKPHWPPNVKVPGVPSGQTEPPGWMVEQWRRIRGLDARDLPGFQPLPLSARRRMTRLFSNPLRGFLRKSLEWLGD